jgi:hypothetical protein
MLCSDFSQFLEQESDGPLSNDAAGHLDTCSNCRFLWRDLAEIRAVSLDWGADEPIPPARLWNSLRAQLEAEGLIRESAGETWGRLGNWFTWVRQPALAGAALSLLLVAATVASVPGFSRAPRLIHDQPLAFSVPSDAPADLDRTLDGDMKLAMASIPEEDSSVTVSLQQNLGIVDNLIAVCEKSVREQPDNQMARDYLYGAYQQKAVLLATAMDHSTLEGR